MQKLFDEDFINSSNIECVECYSIASIVSIAPILYLYHSYLAFRSVCRLSPLDKQDNLLHNFVSIYG